MLNRSNTHLPGHVPKSDKQTLPLAYRLGLNRIDPPPVVRRYTLGGQLGYSMGMKQSNSNRPPAYGVPSGPAIMILLRLKLSSSMNKCDAEKTSHIASLRTSSTRTQTPGGRDVAITASSLAKWNRLRGFRVADCVCSKSFEK